MELGDFGDVQVKLKQAEEKLHEANVLSNEDPSDINLLNNYITARGVRDIAAQNFHTFLSQKARINWIKYGDANTAVFRTSIKLRQTKNEVAELADDAGGINSDQEQIAYLLIKYFKTKFGYQSVHITDSIIDAVPELVSSDDNCLLEKVPTKEDIKDVFFNLNPDGSPGPDGFSGAFYRATWDIICEELVAAIQFCWFNQVITAGLNSNFLILLPKIKGAKKILSMDSNTSTNYKNFHLLNGGPIGYFGVGRGVKQGDPLSPILYVLAADALSRKIIQYIQAGKIAPMRQKIYSKSQNTTYGVLISFWTSGQCNKE
ncbi:uncharacterized protein LOC113360120 [Papaver somniferum]|uniref:uncharacterized protein LOC113360120 n=1 Tax=Papaver somniferum TaxID=3469 RepID=UPI000E701621|nr:uncharacterized protein LOC113360120 [Papaver somniferum]